MNDDRPGGWYILLTNKTKLGDVKLLAPGPRVVATTTGARRYDTKAEAEAAMAKVAIPSGWLPSVGWIADPRERRPIKKVRKQTPCGPIRVHPDQDLFPFTRK